MLIGWKHNKPCEVCRWLTVLRLRLKFGGVEIVLVGVAAGGALRGIVTNGFEVGVEAEFRHFLYGWLDTLQMKSEDERDESRTRFR
jgi:hypothetical protein